MHHHIITVFISVTEVITRGFTFNLFLDNHAFLNVWRQEKVFGFAQENFVRFAMQLADESNPFLVVVLETDHITLQLFRSGRGGVFVNIVRASTVLSLQLLLLFLLVLRDQHTIA